MQTQVKPMTWFLILVALFSAPHLASAYYDPCVQRWINRDPLSDGGSRVLAINDFDPVVDLSMPSLQVERIEGPNLYEPLGNSPTGIWDGFGTAQRGKRGLDCEGFTKRSCPEDVAKALEEAKRLKQLKRAEALRGLLKVIKRGGYMMWFYIEFFWMELEQMAGEQCLEA
jgi:hypothetical protein